jgi:secondary thiamine-phosphate synthase enzyme
MIFQQSLKIKTSGRGLIDITQKIASIVSDAGLAQGICHVFIHHTSASLIICENADNTVKRDLESFMSRLIPDGDKLFHHIAEGSDDMPAHIRTILTQSSLSIPISEGEVSLGIWQGLFLWEHRLQAHDRRITVTLQGE